MNRYSIVYYESKEAMVPSAEQEERESRHDSPHYENLHHYNWDNKQFDTVEATTLGGAYRAFTMSHPDAVVCAVEDLKLWNPGVVVG